MIEIITNNVPRDIFLDTHYGEAVEYKGETYSLEDFQRPANNAFKGWDGYFPDTFFSGILIKYVNDFEQVIMGRYCSS